MDEPCAVHAARVIGHSSALKWRCRVMPTSLLMPAAAIAVNGLLAGASLDQSVKQLPARKRIGVVAYSAYARAADLVNGIPLYAGLGIGAAVLSVMAALVGWRDGHEAAQL